MELNEPSLPAKHTLAVTIKVGELLGRRAREPRQRALGPYERAAMFQTDRRMGIAWFRGFASAAIARAVVNGYPTTVIPTWRQRGKLVFACVLGCLCSVVSTSSASAQEGTHTTSDGGRLPASGEAPALSLAVTNLLLLVDRCSGDGGIEKCRPVTGFIGVAMGVSFYLDEHWSLEPLIFGALQPGDQVTVSTNPGGSEVISRGSLLAGMGVAGRYYPRTVGLWLSPRAQFLVLRDVTVVQNTDADYSSTGEHTLGAGVDVGAGLDWTLTRALGLAVEGRIGLALFPEASADLQRASIGTGPFVSMAVSGVYAL
jgi:hypothetical protein